MAVISDQISVDLVDQSGGDRRVIEAMFASTNLEVGGMTDDQMAGRINFLAKERHGTPFEHNLFTFRVNGPIEMVRQWERHRVGWSYSELSGRYSDMGDSIYQRSDPENWFYKGKPGRETRTVPTPEQMERAQALMVGLKQHVVRSYESLLELGVHREIARGVLPLDTNTTLLASCNARSLMHFLSLRVESPDNTVPTYPKNEINVAANQVEQHFKRAMPMTYKAFVKSGRVAP